MNVKWLFYAVCCLLLMSCQPEPDPIDFGEDQGVYCKMTIADPRYGAELVTDKGKVYKFDAVECMVNYLEEEAPSEREHAYVLAIAADTPGELHSVEEMYFLRSPEMPSPMGANLTGFSTREAAEAAREQHGGEILSWEEVKAYVRQRESI